MSGTDPTTCSVGVESTCEWRVDHIQLDGQEQFVAPHTFAEHVTRMAHALNWDALLRAEQSDTNASGSAAARRALPANTPMRSLEIDLDDGESKAAPRATDTSHDSKLIPKPTTLQDQAPGWQDVGRKLQESLVQLQVLHDVLVIARSGRYLRLDPAAAPVDDEALRFNVIPSGQQPAQVIEHERRVFALGSRRNAAATAGAALMESARRLRPMERQPPTLLAPYLSQLLTLKRQYRMRRIAGETQGDLAYCSIQRAFDPSRTFTVRKVTTATTPYDDQTADAFRIELPSALKRTRTLYAKLIDENGEPTIPAAISEPLLLVDKQLQPHSWQRELARAQHTLIAIDIFKLLQSQAMRMCGERQARVTFVSAGQQKATSSNAVVYVDTLMENDSMLVSLGDQDGQTLLIALVDVDENAPPAGTAEKEPALSALLAQSLLGSYCRQLRAECATAALPQNTAAAIPSDARESALRPHARHIAHVGALALSAHLVDPARLPTRTNTPLLTRIRTLAQHTLVVRRWCALLHRHACGEFDGNDADAHLWWRWTHVDSCASTMRITIAMLGDTATARVRATVWLSADGLRLLMQDEVRARDYAPDVGELAMALRELHAQLRCECMRQLLRSLSDRWTLTEHDVRPRAALKSEDGTAEENVGQPVVRSRVVNVAGTRALTIELPLVGGEPRVRIDAMSSDVDEREIVFSRVPGTRVIDRLDNLLAVLA